MLYISCLYLFLGHFNHIFKIRIMLTNLFSSMGTTLLRLCLPLNHKHNTDPPKLPDRCQTDPLNPAHTNSPLGVRQIRIILLHANFIHRPQCLTPEPRTQSPTRHQNPSLLHPNFPPGFTQIRSILPTQTLRSVSDRFA